MAEPLSPIVRGNHDRYRRHWSTSSHPSVARGPAGRRREQRKRHHTRVVGCKNETWSALSPEDARRKECCARATLDASCASGSAYLRSWRRRQGSCRLTHRREYHTRDPRQARDIRFDLGVHPLDGTERGRERAEARSEAGRVEREMQPSHAARDQLPRDRKHVRDRISLGTQEDELPDIESGQHSDEPEPPELRPIERAVHPGPEPHGTTRVTGRDRELDERSPRDGEAHIPAAVEAVDFERRADVIGSLVVFLPVLERGHAAVNGIPALEQRRRRALAESPSPRAKHTRSLAETPCQSLSERLELRHLEPLGQVSQHSVACDKRLIERRRIPGMQMSADLGRAAIANLPQHGGSRSLPSYLIGREIGRTDPEALEAAVQSNQLADVLDGGSRTRRDPVVFFSVDRDDQRDWGRHQPLPSSCGDSQRSRDGSRVSLPRNCRRANPLERMGSYRSAERPAAVLTARHSQKIV